MSSSWLEFRNVKQQPSTCIGQLGTATSMFVYQLAQLHAIDIMSYATLPLYTSHHKFLKHKLCTCFVPRLVAQSTCISMF